MQEAAVDRLSKLISDTDTRKGTGGTDNGNKSGPRRPAIHVHLGLDEGWFSLFLVATVVYSTIWCVQAADWVDHLSILTLTTALGLVMGVIGAKQKRFSRLAVHTVAIIFGLLLAYWQTAGAFYDGNVAALTGGIHQWIIASLAGATSNDDSIFLFFITALGFVLAYTSAWLVYRTRNPWLMILANAVVLLINLNNIDSGYIVFLVVFLMASLLLLLRFNLYESVRRWRRQGLRYADDLSWDVMQAGALISIGILILSWILPYGYTNETAALVWNDNQNPWVQIENTWNRIIAVNSNVNPSNHGNFDDTLTLGGNPNLNNDIVFKVQSDDPTQYLETLSYDTYDGRGWYNSPTYATALPAKNSTVNESSVFHYDKQTVYVVNPPGEQFNYILGASQVASLDQSSQVLNSKATSSQVALVGQGKLSPGQHYVVYSYVSSADVNSLETVSLPVNEPKIPSTYDGQYPLTYFDPGIVNTYLQLPQGLDPRIKALAQQLTASSTTMYDKAQALESYFHTFTYDVNVQLPSGMEGVSWFLFDSGHRGFCNYFATSMAVMARLLGMPARVVAGYTNGQLDATHHQQVIRGTDAHLWTQIYFAGYGWINFEPSAGFSTFSRPLASQFSSGSSGGSPGSNGGSNTVAPVKPHGATGNSLSGGNNSGQASSSVGLQASQQAGIAVGALVLLILFCLILFSIWWRRLFRSYRLSAQIYGRICLLAAWAGISLEPSQTPYEYINSVAEVTPQDATVLQRFGDIYVREIWADPDSADHPRRTGEVNELSSLWRSLQPHLFLYVLRHPRFLKYVPVRVSGTLRQARARRKAKRAFDEDV